MLGCQHDDDWNTDIEGNPNEYAGGDWPKDKSSVPHDSMPAAVGAGCRPDDCGAAQMVSRWTAALAKAKKLEGQLAKAWTRTRVADLLAKKKTWAAVTGPTTGVVKTFTDLEWDMVIPTTWSYIGKQCKEE